MNDQTTNTFIFVHIPKTAGTSFREAARDYFGNSGIIEDYGPASSNTSEIVRKASSPGNSILLRDQLATEEKVLFTGYFHVRAYLPTLGKNLNWCVFIRNPLTRMLSEYQHLLQYERLNQPFEEFCCSPQQTNRQSQLIQGLKLEEFFFVGVTEYYSSSMQVFNCLTGFDLPTLKINTTNTKEQVNSSQISTEVIKKIKAENSIDFNLHGLAKERLRADMERLHLGNELS